MDILFEEKLVSEYSHSEVSDWRAAMAGVVATARETAVKDLDEAIELVEQECYGEALSLLTPLYLATFISRKMKARVELYLAKVMLATDHPEQARLLLNRAKGHLSATEQEEADKLDIKARSLYD